MLTEICFDIMVGIENKWNTLEQGLSTFTLSKDSCAANLLSQTGSHIAQYFLLNIY
jgi:hypothetical protein